MQLPQGRGPTSIRLVDALRAGDPHRVPSVFETPHDPLVDDDLQLALWVCHELFYRGFDGVDERWEWNPQVIALRSGLEDVLLARLRADVTVHPDYRPVADRLRAVLDADDGPSLSRFLQTTATRQQFREYARCRSVYQLKEADPHTWAIPRLTGRAKAALVEIQADEYGAGGPTRIHAELFRRVLRELDLDDGYGAHVGDAPAVALALSNVMSVLGLRRELRGALVGHLAAYEMSSSTPCRRYAKGLRRLGSSDAACAFYDAHVTADALHEQIAMHDLCGALVADEPRLADDVVFGAALCLHVESRFAEHLFDAWQAPELAAAG